MRSHLSDSVSSKGFTLLELLLVVVILSSMAWMLTGTMEDNVGQARYEDTRNRLDAIRVAVLGPSSPGTWERGIQSGYVVDNGRLPEDMNALVTSPTNYHPFGAFVPIFDPTPSILSDGRAISNDDGDEIFLPNAEHQLMKGHRGAYLPSSTSGMFRDGWGTSRDLDGADGIDCPTVPGVGNEGNDLDWKNHGWCVTLSSEDGFYVDSYGRDGQVGALSDDPDDGTDPVDPYELDVSMSPSIVRDDWKVPLSGASVTLKNMTGENLSGENFKISLLVYLNGDANNDGEANELYTILDGKYEAQNSWWSVTTESFTISSLSANSEQTISLSFSDTVNSEIPVGEHLLVLVADDNPDLDSFFDSTGTPKYVTKRVKFFSRGGVPDMVLEIR
jgi:prepilin-type N-terminal cleavage/methylation domain-containing protein